MKYKLRSIFLLASLCLPIAATAQTNSLGQKLDKIFVQPFANITLSYSNVYSAHEVEMGLGVGSTYQNIRTRSGYGLAFDLTTWSTLHTGEGVRIGVNNLRQIGPYLIDYTEAVYETRFFWSRFAYGPRFAIGKSFDDGSTYVEPGALLEFRFSPTFGIKADVDYKFTTSKGEGICGEGGLCWTF